MRQRFASIGVAFALTIGLLVAGTAAAQAESFILRNNGDTTIYHAYVSRASSSVWGSDILGQDVLSPGYQTTVSWPGSSFDTCYWDVAVVYSDGHTDYDWDVNFCNIGTVTSSY